MKYFVTNLFNMVFAALLGFIIGVVGLHIIVKTDPEWVEEEYHYVKKTE